jgi:hypothetical protein
VPYKRLLKFPLAGTVPPVDLAIQAPVEIALGLKITTNRPQVGDFASFRSIGYWKTGSWMGSIVLFSSRMPPIFAHPVFLAVFCFQRQYQMHSNIEP